MAQCYLNLNLYEDTIETCDQGLAHHKDHVYLLFLKAKSLAYLFEFD